jgi:hypothetical protein
LFLMVHKGNLPTKSELHQHHINIQRRNQDLTHEYQSKQSQTYHNIMADNGASDDSPSKLTSPPAHHRRTTSAVPKLGLVSRTTESDAPPLPARSQRREPPKSASLLPKDQLPISNVQVLRADWESRDRCANEVQSPIIEKPLKRSGAAHDPDDLPKFTTDASVHELFKSISNPTHNEPAMPLLGLSDVQTIYEEEPIYPSQLCGRSMPGQVTQMRSIAQMNKQLVKVTPARIVTSPHLPSSEPTKALSYMSAFEYALRPFLNLDVNDNQKDLHHSPSPTSQYSESDIASPFVLPAQEDASTSLGSKVETHDGSENDNSAPLKKLGTFSTHIQHIQLRTLLMQCTMLQNTVRELECKPWTMGKAHIPRWQYEKMRSLAYKALQLAQALESRDLQARCEYWAGRGCGGTRDYQAAEAHFSEAIRLDDSNQDGCSDTQRAKGLRPMERQDVQFLLESCKARHKDWKKRTDKMVELAKKQSINTDKSLQACLDENPIVSPPWIPDHEYMIEVARRSFGIAKSPSKITTPFVHRNRGQALEAQVQAQRTIDGQDLMKATKRTLSRKEWEYIRHGNMRGRAPQQSVDKVRDTNSSPSGAILRQLPPPAGSPKVLSGLKQYNRLQDKTSPALANLLQRRQISLKSVRTESFQKQPHIGNTTHASSLVPKSKGQDAESANGKEAISTKPHPLLASSTLLRRNPPSSVLPPVPEFDDGKDEPPVSAPIDQSSPLLPLAEQSQSNLDNQIKKETKIKDGSKNLLEMLITTNAKRKQRSQLEWQHEKAKKRLEQLESTDPSKYSPRMSLPSTPLRTNLDMNLLKGNGVKGLISAFETVKINSMRMAESPLNSPCSYASSLSGRT